MKLVWKGQIRFGTDLDGDGGHGELSLLDMLNSASVINKITNTHELLGEAAALWLSFLQRSLLHVPLEASRST